MSALDNDDTCEQLIYDICRKYVPGYYTQSFNDTEYCNNLNTLREYVKTCSVCWYKFQGIATQLKLQCHGCTSTFPAMCLRTCITDELDHHIQITCNQQNKPNEHLKNIFRREQIIQAQQKKARNRHNYQEAETLAGITGNNVIINK